MLLANNINVFFIGCLFVLVVMLAIGLIGLFFDNENKDLKTFGNIVKRFRNQPKKDKPKDNNKKIK